MSLQRDQIRAQIRGMILEHFLPGAGEDALADDVSLERSHVVDSVSVLELIVFIEETYGFAVDNEDAIPENFDTVNAIVEYVARRSGAT